MVHLHVRSWFSFLAGASPPEALARVAAEHGQPALALTDRHGLYGLVRHARACRALGIRPLFGATLTVSGFPLILLVQDQGGYQRLCRLLSAAHAAHRLEPHLPVEALSGQTTGLLCLTGGPEGRLDTLVRLGQEGEARRWLGALGDLFPRSLYVELVHRDRPGDGAALERLIRLAREARLPTVITNAVRHATREAFALQDALSCVRLGLDIGQSHPARPVNDAAWLCDAAELLRRIPHPEALERTLEIAARCQLELLADGVLPPAARVPAGRSPEAHLRDLCERALPERHPPPERARARAQLERELEVVGALGLSEFFLVVQEVVEFARSRGIRCAGRGSAANSLVAWLLGITAVDPLAHRLLFERFLHRGRRGMPDIDVDFDTSRRDEVIAWMEDRFGRDHTAMTATVITYQVRSAVRDMLKVLGCPPEGIDRVARRIGPWDTLADLRARREELQRALLGEAAPAGSGVGAEPQEASPGPRQGDLWEVLFSLAEALQGCPRHLGLHSGGMVLSRAPLEQLSPLQTSAKGVRQLQFDKDDVEALGLIKLDVLGLRMLGVLSEAVALHRQETGQDMDLDALPLDDEPTYELLRSGRTLGLFQVESPGQMQLLARTRPREFRDLVIQVALFRPGPLQGGMVHPYLERRAGRAPVTFAHPSLAPILGDTMGVLLFQEQVLEICHRFAGMELEEADEFRRLMSRWRDPGCMRRMGDSFIAQAIATHGVPRELAAQVFDQVAAFVGYGFCRSHAAAFARTVYQSAWLKRHRPAAYMAAVLQHRPGFYPLSTLAEEARHLGLQLLPVDLWRSGWRYQVEEGAIRAPLCAVQGVSPEAARQLIALRAECQGLEALIERSGLPSGLWEQLARAGALRSLPGEPSGRPRVERREGLWRVGLMRSRRGSAGAAGGRPSRRAEQLLLPLEASPAPALIPALPRLREGESLAWDHMTQGMSPRAHPLARHRPRLDRLGVTPIGALLGARRPRRAGVAGVTVICQRPPTARGVGFLTLEDETGRIQAVLPPALFEQVKPILSQGALWVQGTLAAREGPGPGPEGSAPPTLKATRILPLEPFMGAALFG